MTSNNEPSNDELLKIAEKAEQDLNTYQAKTGRARGHDLEEVSGVDSRAPKYFPGADLRYGDDLKTNASWDRPIPEEEGGVTDDRGRMSKGRHFEGPGGPEDKAELNPRHRGGRNDPDVLPKSALGPMGERETKERRGRSPLDQGRDASEVNVGPRVEGTIGGAKFRRTDYEEPEIADELGLIPPKSVVGKSAGLQ